MTIFVVTFIGLLATVLILSPLLWHLMRENAMYQEFLHTARNEVADTLRLADNYRMACEHASDGLVIQDMTGKVLWTNPAYCRILGLEPGDVIGRNPLEFALPPSKTPPPDEIAAFRYDPNDPAHQRLQLFKNQHSNGHQFWNQISVSFRKAADGRDSAILVCRDVTEQVERQKNLEEISAKLEHQASHDDLTGVANRASFLSFVSNAIGNNKTATIGLLHIDLDNFKDVNDTHGHSAGDAVLCHAASVIQQAIRPSDLVARVGGDEFVVVCPDSPDLTFLDQLANALLREIASPFSWSNRNLQIEASIGAALSDDALTDPEDLLVHADFALYEAKRAGRNQVALYDEKLHDLHAFRTRRASELAIAIKTGRLEYAFQPTMELATGQVEGLECLVRWNHPDEGMIPPDEFLPMVKDLGLMAQLDMLSMGAALRQKKKLNLAGFNDLKVAFNASPELLGHPDFLNRLVWGVEAEDIRRDHVTIEVLETTEFGSAVEKSTHAAIIRELREAGFRVHLDDFGIGFAGLSHLAMLDVSGVKIDRGLITDFIHNETSKKIVRRIIDLSNDLGLTVIAEGVEDWRTANALHQMGCGIIQGYWLSRPLPANTLPDFLSNRASGPNPLSA